MRKKIWLAAGLLLGLIAIPAMAFGAQLEWNSSTGDAEGYRIYFGTSSGEYPEMKEVGTTTQCSLNDLPLKDNTTYYFVVRAYNNAGESANSNEISWTSGDATPPMPPQGVVVE